MSGDQMQQRRGLAADWASTNYVLADGEFGIATDSRVVKIGDGVTPWNSLISLMDLLSRVAKAGDIMTGRLQLPELGVTGGTTLTLRQAGTATLANFAAGQVFDSGTRVYSPSNPQPSTGGGATMKFQEFLANGTFTAPKTGYYRVRGYGGAGGSGGVRVESANQKSCSGGGSSGEFVEKMVSLTIGDVVSVVVGAGGAGGTGSTWSQGLPGQNTTFGAYLTARGGSGSLGISASNGPSGSPSMGYSSPGASIGVVSANVVCAGSGAGCSSHAKAAQLLSYGTTATGTLIDPPAITAGFTGSTAFSRTDIAEVLALPLPGLGINGKGFGGPGGGGLTNGAAYVASPGAGVHNVLTAVGSIAGGNALANSASGASGGVCWVATNTVVAVNGGTGGSGYLSIEWTE